jgi:glycyl-tRNA synthetase beta chain
VPQECLILTMQQNQKYFALEDGKGQLLPRFLLVSNTETADPARDRRGQRARPARAPRRRALFLRPGSQGPLETRVPRLGSIVYHNKLGTQLDRTARLAKLASASPCMIGAEPLLASRAAQLAKADLTTDMVGEFPELQGLMGRYYAEHDHEPAEVATAIEEHYWPRFAGDALPEAPVRPGGRARRQARDAGRNVRHRRAAHRRQGSVRTSPPRDRSDPDRRREAPLVALPDLIGAAFDAFASVPAVADARARAGRLHLRAPARLSARRRVHREPGRGRAVPASRAPRSRARAGAAVRAFGELPEADALAAANKRIVNILKKSGSEAALAVDRARLADGAEHDLYLALQKLQPIVDDRCTTGDFAGALLALASAKPAVDKFFDDVLVMAGRPRDPRQPARAAARRRPDDEPRRRHLEARRLMDGLLAP